MSGAGGWIRLVPIAVLVTALLAGAATWAQSAGIEQDLTARTQAALAAAGLAGGTVTFGGRDATLSGFPPDKALNALQVVQGVDGVRSAEISGDVTPFTPAPTTVPAPTPTTTAPPSTTPPPATTAPPTDRAGLQAEVDRILAGSPIGFQPDSAKLTPEGEQAAKDVAKALSRAPANFRYRVTGHAGRGPGGERTALKLSQDRARAVARILTTNGVPANHVTSRGLGDTRPTPGDDRRVEITVVEG